MSATLLLLPTLSNVLILLLILSLLQCPDAFFSSYLRHIQQGHHVGDLRGSEYLRLMEVKVAVRRHYHHLSPILASLLLEVADYSTSFNMTDDVFNRVTTRNLPDMPSTPLQVWSPDDNNSSHRRYLLEDLIAIGGAKQLLQEIGKVVFKGSNPTYTWTDRNNTVVISIADVVRYQYTMKEKLDRPLSNNIRKQQEIFAAEKLIRFLLKTEQYKSKVDAYLSQRANRDNAATLMTRSDVFSIAKDKSVIVLIDVENVPDFRSNLYIGIDGFVRFSSPASPPVIVAPSLTPDDSTSSFTQSISSPQDEDILILCYAHSKSPQSVRANRITQDDRKDAADGKNNYQKLSSKEVLKFYFYFKSP